MNDDRKVLLVASLYHWCNDASVILLPALFPILIDVFSMSYTDIGLLSGFGLVVTILTQLAAGHWSDTRSAPIMLAAGISVLGVGMLIIPLASSFMMLFMIVMVARIGASFYHPVGVSWLSNQFSGKDLDGAMGLQSSLGDVGVIFGMVSAGFMGVYLGWKVPFIIWGIVNLLAVASAIALRPPRTVLKSRSNIKTHVVFREMAPYLAPIIASGAIYSITVNMGPLLLTNRYLLGAEVADSIIALWIGAGAVAAYLYSRYGARAGRERVLVGSYLVLTFSSALVFVLDAVPVVSLFLVVSGAMLLLSYPAVFSLFSMNVGRGARGRAFGIFFALNLAGGAAASYISGWTADIYGIKWPFIYIVALAGVTTAISAICIGRGVRKA